MAAGVAGPLIKIALGKGKAAKAEYALQPLEEIAAGLKALPKDISLKYQLRALRKAAKPGMEALRSRVSQIGQVTGNLLASVSKAERKYTNNRQNLPVSVVVVGFRRPTNSKSQKMATPAFAGGAVLKGPNRAYHSHLVEFGTAPRQAGKSRRSGRKRVVLGGRLRTIINREKQAGSPRAILSSFKSRGPFTRGGAYPKDFITTGTVRGARAQHPLQHAYTSSKSQMESVLNTEMRKALTQAIKAYEKQNGGLG